MKQRYFVEIPLTGTASGYVEAESEEEAIEKFDADCIVDDIEWGLDLNRGTAHVEQP